MLKEIKAHLNKWTLVLFKCQFVLRLTYSLHAILTKSEQDCSVAINKLILQLTWKGKGYRRAKASLKKTTKAGGLR